MSDDTWKAIADRFADLHAKAEARAEAAEKEAEEFRAALDRGPFAAVEAQAEINHWRERAEASEAMTPMAYAWTLFSGASIIKRRLTWTNDDPFAGSEVYGDVYQVVGVPLYKKAKP